MNPYKKRRMNNLRRMRKRIARLRSKKSYLPKLIIALMA